MCRIVEDIVKKEREEAFNEAYSEAFNDAFLTCPEHERTEIFTCADDHIVQTQRGRGHCSTKETGASYPRVKIIRGTVLVISTDHRNRPPDYCLNCLIHLNDLDLVGGEACRLVHHVHQLGGVRLGQAALRCGHRQTEGVLPMKATQSA